MKIVRNYTVRRASYIHLVTARLNSPAEEHQNTYSAISNDVFALQSATDQIAQSIEGMELQVEREVGEMVGHAEAIVDEARALVVEDPGECIGGGPEL